MWGILMGRTGRFPQLMAESCCHWLHVNFNGSIPAAATSTYDKCKSIKDSVVKVKKILPTIGKNYNSQRPVFVVYFES